MSTNRDGAAAEAGIVTELSGSNLDGTKAAAPKLQPAGGLFGLAALSALSAKPARKFAPAAAARRKPGVTGPAPAPAPSAPAPGPAAGATALEGASDAPAAAAGSGAGMGAGSGVGSGADIGAGGGVGSGASSEADIAGASQTSQPLLTNGTHSHISNTAAAAGAGTAAGSGAAPLAPLPQQAPAPAAASRAPPASGPGPPAGSSPSSSKLSGAGPAAASSTVSRDQPSSCLPDLTSLGNKGRPVAELAAGEGTQGKTRRELEAQQAPTHAPDHSADVSDGAGRALGTPAARLAGGDVQEPPDLTSASPQPQPQQAIPTAPMVAPQPLQQDHCNQPDQRDQREAAALGTPEQQQQQQNPLSLPLQQEQGQQEEHEARQQQLRQQRATQQQQSLMALTAKTQDPLLLELLQEQLQRLADTPAAPSPPPHLSQDSAPSPGGRAKAAVGAGVASTAGLGEGGEGGAGSGAVAAADAGAAAAGVPSGQEGAEAVGEDGAREAADSAPRSSRRTKRPAVETKSAEVAAAQAADLGLKKAAGAAVGKPGKRMARPQPGSQATANTEGSPGPEGNAVKEGAAGQALRPRRSAASAVATLPSSSSRRRKAAAGRPGPGSGSEVATDGKSERSEGSEVSESDESEAGSEDESDDESEEKEGNGKSSSKGAKQVKRRRASNKLTSPEELKAALQRRKTCRHAGEGGGKRRRGPLTPEEELERKRSRLEALRAHTRMMIDQISITPALKQQAHDFVTRICGLRRVLAPAGPASACEPAAGARIEARSDDGPLRREPGPTGSAEEGGPAEATGSTAGVEKKGSFSPVGPSLALVAGTSGELSAAREEVDELLEVAKAEQQILCLTKALESCKPGAVARVLQLPGHLRSPQGDRERPVDLKTWSLKRIIARTQAWDRAKDAEVRAAREQAQEQAAARMLLERGAAERGEAGQGALEQLDEDDQAALLPGYQPRSRGGAQAAAEPPEDGEGREGGGEGLMAPRVQVTADGRLVVDESSLTMQAQRVELASYERVEEGVTRTLNSASYTKRAQSERWDAEETALFYRALKAFGTDFAMIAQLYPYRTRLSIKNKFNKEERDNASQVHAAMKSSATDLADQRVLIDLVRQNMASPPAAGARPPKPGGRGRGKPGARGGGRAPARLHASPSPDADGSPTQEAVGTDAAAAAPQPAVRGDKGTAQRLQDQPPVVEGHQAARQTAPAPTANAVAAADKSSAAAQGPPKSTPQDARGAAALRGAAQPPARPSQPRGLRDVAPPAAPAQQSAGTPQAIEAPKEVQKPQPAIAQPDHALNEAAQPASALAKGGAEPRQASGPSALPALGFMGLPGGLGELQSRTRKVAPSLVRRGVTAPRPSAPRNPRPSAAAPDVAPGPASAPAVTQPPAPAPEPTTGAAEEAGVPHEEDEEMMYNY